MQFKNMLQRSLKWASSWRFLKRQKGPSILSVEANRTTSDEKQTALLLKKCMWIFVGSNGRLD